MDNLRKLAMAALATHERTKEGFDKYRAANRALRRETHPNAVLQLLDRIQELESLNKVNDGIIAYLRSERDDFDFEAWADSMGLDELGDEYKWASRVLQAARHTV